MLNKEVKEKVKKHYIFTTEHELDDNNKTLKEYIKYLEQKESILDKVTEFIKDDVTTEDIKFEGSKLFSKVYKSLISKTKEKIAEGINSYKDQIEKIIEGEKNIGK